MTEPAQVATRPAWRLHAVLFLATVASVFFQAEIALSGQPSHSPAAFAYAARFTASLLSILAVHEAGHYVAARVHKVDTSLPYFIPVPFGLGTMGAVIRMRGSIPTRRALLDIGASGPLAGLVVAIPLYVWGVAHSHPAPLTDDMGQLGESLLVRFIERAVAPAIPPGQDLLLSPVAFGAWAGLFVTMINLIPVGQLDGGHVAYALFGPRQNRFAVVVHRSMLAFSLVSIASFVARDVRGGLGLHHIGAAVGSSLFWLVWFQVLTILDTLTQRAGGSEGASAARETLPLRTRALALVGLVGTAWIGAQYDRPIVWAAWFVGLGLLVAMEAKSGAFRAHSLLDHPPTSDAPLDPVRAVVAVVTLAFFVLLFMPSPFPL